MTEQKSGLLYVKCGGSQSHTSYSAYTSAGKQTGEDLVERALDIIKKRLFQARGWHIWSYGALENGFNCRRGGYFSP